MESHPGLIRPSRREGEGLNLIGIAYLRVAHSVTPFVRLSTLGRGVAPGCRAAGVWSGDRQMDPYEKFPLQRTLPTPAMKGISPFQYGGGHGMERIVISCRRASYRKKRQ
ncbi:hypothetical protein CEXT_553961 [Caerostris extrusa]|uniref:Uncharacterized protein n=1 Tax=Caerostris extrusa TaxID=172846 RepID=A0AAV4P9U3_CAEEX|nr:hypothetical protein CEXT_553961 [Caerostris extrusa]